MVKQFDVLTIFLYLFSQKQSEILRNIDSLVYNG